MTPAHGCPLNVGNLGHDHVSHPLGHVAVDKQLNKTHGAADHQQNIEVQTGENVGDGQHAQKNEKNAGSQCDIGTVLAEGQHQYICGCEQNDGK